jgi:hypothetical protein
MSRPNLFDGLCKKCGLIVPAGEGVLIRYEVTQRSDVYHTTCASRVEASLEVSGPPEPAAEPAREPTEAELQKAVEELLRRTTEAFP